MWATHHRFPMPYLANLSNRLNASTAPGLLLSAGVSAQASHPLTIVVPEVERLSTSPDPVRLAFATPPPGEPFADGIELAVRLEAPVGAASLGCVELQTEPRDLVADVAAVGETGLGIAYTASADVSTLPNGAGETRTVTYTVTDP